MLLIRSLLKGVSGMFFILSLALSFAPPTDRERAALNDNYERMDIVQLRAATGALKLDRYGLIDWFAEANGVEADALHRALTLAANGRLNRRCNSLGCRFDY